MNLDEISAHLVATWGKKTLAEFRDEADREDTGIVFESIRIPEGPRFAIIICLTDTDHISRVEGALNLVDDNILEDWNTFTLGEVFRRTVVGQGLSFESLRDEYGRRCALILCATEPRSMQIVSSLFKLPD